MRWLNRLKMWQLIVLLLLIPITLSVVAIVRQAWSSYDELVESQQIAEEALLFDRISNFIHETQIERGMTGVYLASKGTKFKDELAAQRAKADVRMREMTEFVAHFPIDDYPEIKEILHESMEYPDGLIRPMANTANHYYAHTKDGGVRAQVDGLKVSVSQAIDYYTHMHTDLLEVVTAFSGRNASLGDVGRALSAYTNLMRGKELAGIERALVSSTLTQGGFLPGKFIRFGQLVAQQEVLFDAFVQQAMPEQQAFYKEKVKLPVFAEVEEMRQRVFKAGSASRLYVLLGQIVEIYGFRGFIHFEKNALIRPGRAAEYIGKLKVAHAEMSKLLEKAKGFTEINDMERAKLDAIQANIDTYLAIADKIVAGHVAGKNTQELDGELKVNDDAAGKALDELFAQEAVGKFGVETPVWFEKITNKINILREVEGFVSHGLQQQVSHRIHEARLWMIVTGVTALILLGVTLGIAMAIARMILQLVGGEPAMILAIVEQITKGNLKVHALLKEYGLEASRATGILQSIIRMADALQSMIRTIGQRAERLGRASLEMNQVSGEMSQGADTLTTRSARVAVAAKQMNANMDTIRGAVEEMAATMHEVSGAAQQMDSNMNTISAAAEEASTNLNAVAAASEQASVSMNHVREAVGRVNENISTVASAVEEMNASLGEVRHRCVAASGEAGQAEGEAQEAHRVMTQLSGSAQEIGSMVAVINSIAEKTNMLSLNAAIEAAGAGEAGKGFAVVANEVKDLARQTREATRMIADQIQTVQKDTRNAGQATDQIAGIIQRLKVSNEEILHAVDEQTRTLGEITRSLGNTSRETGEVAHRVGEATHGIEEVARNVQEISSGIGEVTRNVTHASVGVGHVNRQIAELSHGAGSISHNVNESTQSTHRIAQDMNDVQGASENMQSLGSRVSTQAGQMEGISGELSRELSRFDIAAS